MMLRSFSQLAVRFRADENGSTAIEYALIAAGISVAIVTTVFGLGTQIKTALWDKVGNAM